MSKKKNKITPEVKKVVGRQIKYVCSRDFYNALFEEIKTPEGIVEYINGLFGLLGTVTEVVIEG